MRYSLNTLAYIDVGSDNGGIVLNLTEDGMAFQAVGPLEGQQEVSLRIQLPNSANRIETAAKIVWLSESNRQAGVRFLDLSPAGRAQILEWIHLQTAPLEVGATEPFESFAQRQVPEEPPQKKAPIRETRTDKWLSLMADLQLPEVEPSKTDPMGTTSTSKSQEPIESTSTGKISLRELSARLRASQALPQHPVEYADSTTASAPSVRAPEQPVRPQSPIEPPRSAFLDRAAPPNTSPSFVTDPEMRGETSHSSVLPARDAFGVPYQALSPISHTDPWHADPWSVAPTRTIDWVSATTPAATAYISAVARTSILKWVGAIIVFGLLAVLSFALGAWIGSLGAPAPRPQAEPPAGAITAPPSAGQANDQASQGRRATNKRTGGGHHAPDVRPESHDRTGVSMPTQGPVAPGTSNQVATGQTALSASSAQGPSDTSSGVSTPPTTPAPVPTQNVKASAPLPTSEGSTAFDSGPRVVAGRILRPTDRFIPCHLMYRVEPIYPPEAKEKGIEGTVKIHLSVSADGTVGNIQLVEGPPLLIPAALDAAQYWRYMPALLNGQPVEIEQDIEIAFRLPR